MDVVKCITQEELNEKDDQWFKEEYFKIFFEIRKRQQDASAYAITYYRANRDKILKKRQEHQKKAKEEVPKRPRGRPRKYDISSDYEIDVVIV